MGGYCIVGASNSFNQIIERDKDLLMDRTKLRPLPTKQISTQNAFWMSVILTLLGLFMLYMINYKTAFFAAVSVFLYTCVYTPLKPITPLSVFVGAIPGAIPFMLGWVAATNEFGIEPGILFMLQFFWQFPHFWAIGWLMHDQYKSAGFKMLPSGERDQSTAFQIVFYTFWTILISIIPAFEYTGRLYISEYALILVLIFGAIFLYYAFRLMVLKSDFAARMLLRVSIIYITCVQIIYVSDKILFQ
mgnify:CR=1 FL=1